MNHIAETRAAGDTVSAGSFPHVKVFYGLYLYENDRHWRMDPGRFAFSLSAVVSNVPLSFRVRCLYSYVRLTIKKYEYNRSRGNHIQCGEKACLY